MKIRTLKKLLCFTIATIIALSVTLFASAEPATPYDLTSASKHSSLSIDSNGTVTMMSNFETSDRSVIQVDIEHSLEKHAYLWTWNNVGGKSSKTVFDCVNYLITYRTGLESGTYRLKSVFTAYLDDGRSETVTVYSNELTI